MILSDRTLREQIADGRIIIEPFDDHFVQPSSIDVRISNLFRVFRNYTARCHRREARHGDADRADRDRTTTACSCCIPASSCSAARSSASACPMIWSVASRESRASAGSGLIIHSTAGFIDAGFDGHITLELTNIATLPITLYPGMKIGQVSFMQMTTPADKPYGSGATGSKYQGQRGPDAEPLLRELRTRRSNAHASQTNQPVRSTTW